MPLGRGQIDQPAFTENVNPPAVLEGELFDKIAHSALLAFVIFSSASMSISTLKCPELQTMAPSFIFGEMLHADDIDITGQGDERYRRSWRPRPSA